MSAKAELKGKISMNTSGASRAVTKFRREIGELGKSAGKAAINVAGMGLQALSAAGISAAVGIAYGTKKVFELGAELKHLSDRTGIAVDGLAIMQQQFKDAGVDSGELAGAVGKLQKNLVEATRTGAGPAAAALDLIGESASELIRMNPAEYFTRVGKGIAKIKNPAVQAATAIALFGKQGATLLPVFKGDSFEAMAKIVGHQAQLLKQNAQLFLDINNRLGHAGLKIQGLFVGFASAISPELNAALKKFDDLDLSAQGEKFGNFIKDAAESFKTSTEGSMAAMRAMWEMMKATPAVAAKGITGIQKAGGWLGDLYSKGESAVGEIENWAMNKGTGMDTSNQPHAPVAPKDRHIKTQGVFPTDNAAPGTVSHPDEEEKKLNFWKTGAETNNRRAGLDPNTYRFSSASSSPFGRKHRGWNGKFNGATISEDWKSKLKDPDQLAKFLNTSGGQNDRVAHSTSLSNLIPGEMLDSAKGGLGSNGGLSRGAYGQTDLLKHSERMKYSDANYAAVLANPNSTDDERAAARDMRGSGRGMNVVRNGDKDRAKNLQKEELRKSLTLEGTNSLLKQTLDFQKQTWGPSGGAGKN